MKKKSDLLAIFILFHLGQCNRVFEHLESAPGILYGRGTYVHFRACSATFIELY